MVLFGVLSCRYWDRCNYRENVLKVEIINVLYFKLGFNLYLRIFWIEVRSGIIYINF